MENLRELFERALDDEPATAAGDPAGQAIAEGSRLRRRRNLRYGGLAGGVAAAIAAIVALNVTATGTPTLQEAGVSTPKPRCTAADQTAGVIFVYLKTPIADAQRTSLDHFVSTSPEIAKFSFESRAQAYQRFQDLWKKYPDFVKSVGPEALPESYRIEMAEPDHYQLLRAQLKKQKGVEEVVGWSCPAGANLDETFEQLNRIANRNPPR